MKFDVDLDKKVIKVNECNISIKELKIMLARYFDMPDIDDYFIVVEPIIVEKFMPSPNPIIIEKYKDNTNPYYPFSPCTPFPNYPIITYSSTSNG